MVNNGSHELFRDLYFELIAILYSNTNFSLQYVVKYINDNAPYLSWDKRTLEEFEAIEIQRLLMEQKGISLTSHLFTPVN